MGHFLVMYMVPSSDSCIWDSLVGHVCDDVCRLLSVKHVCHLCVL